MVDSGSFVLGSKNKGVSALSSLLSKGLDSEKNLWASVFVAEIRILGSRSSIFTKRLFAVSIIFNLLSEFTSFGDFQVFLLRKVNVACFVFVDHFIVGLARERGFSQKP